MTTRQNTQAPTSRATTWLLGSLLVFLLIGAWLLYELIINNPKYVTQNALARTFFSTNNTMSASGDIYIESLQTGELYGAQFSGGVSWNGATDLRITSRILPSDVTAKLVKPARNAPLYGSISGVADITHMFVVGASKQDIAMYQLLSEQKQHIDGTWYSFDDIAFADSLRQLGVPMFPAGFSDAERAQMAELYAQYPFLVVDEMYRGEILLQKPTIQYKVRVDKTLFTMFMQNIETQSGSFDANSLERFQGQMDHIQALQVWINPTSQLLEQAYVVYQAKDIRYSLRVRLHNESVEVAPAEPQNPKPITELTKLMGINL
ncbi:MAG: hypothetical protein WBP26_01210 [Candidatus Saccharimonadales bacterium]